MTMDSGTLDKLKAPVEDTKTFSSITNPLREEMSDPVAIKIFLASIDSEFFEFS